MKVSLHRWRNVGIRSFIPRPYFRYEGSEELAVGISVWLHNEAGAPALEAELLVQHMPDRLDEALDFVLRDRRSGHEKPALTRRKDYTDA